MAQVRKNQHAPLSWLLIVGFLCQPILTYLVTPTSVPTPGGFYAVVCTLKGVKKDILVDLPAIDRAQGPAEDCPAIKLMQLAGISLAPEVQVVPATVLYSVGLLEQTGGHSHHRIHFSAYSSRAPPLA